MSGATALRAVDALDAWERGDRLPRARRGDALLTGVPGAGAGLPVGRRDALLLDRFRSSFGDRLDAVAGCPGCGTTVELALSCTEVLAAGEAAPTPVAPLELGGYRVTWRPVTGVDLAALATADLSAAGNSTVDAAAELWRRCVVEATGPAGALAADALPAPVRAAVLDAMVRADPYIEITFALSCPACGRRWDSQLDVAAFAWDRIQHRAQQVLGEVHTLAGAYGWTEPDVLALSESRRAAYLRLVGDD